MNYQFFLILLISQWLMFFDLVHSSCQDVKGKAIPRKLNSLYIRDDDHYFIDEAGYIFVITNHHGQIFRINDDNEREFWCSINNLDLTVEFESFDISSRFSRSGRELECKLWSNWFIETEKHKEKCPRDFDLVTSGKIYSCMNQYRWMDVQEMMIYDAEISKILKEYANSLCTYKSEQSKQNNKLNWAKAGTAIVSTISDISDKGFEVVDKIVTGGRLTPAYQAITSGLKSGAIDPLGTTPHGDKKLKILKIGLILVIDYSFMMIKPTTMEGEFFKTLSKNIIKEAIDSTIKCIKWHKNNESNANQKCQKEFMLGQMKALSESAGSVALKENLKTIKRPKDFEGWFFNEVLNKKEVKEFLASSIAQGVNKAIHRLYDLV